MAKINYIRAAGLLLLIGAGAYAQTPAQTSVQGTITSMTAKAFTLAVQGGSDVVVSLDQNLLVLETRPAALAEIRQGDALGVAATRMPDGSLTATSINVFPPELWKNARKGQWPMQSGEVMTNAVVLDLATERVAGNTLYMKWEDVSATIAVPLEAVIHRILVVSMADLKPGMTIRVVGRKPRRGTSPLPQSPLMREAFFSRLESGQGADEQSP